jgi:hypothetical protein
LYDKIVQLKKALSTVLPLDFTFQITSLPPSIAGVHQMGDRVDDHRREATNMAGQTALKGATE